MLGSDAVWVLVIPGRNKLIAGELLRRSRIASRKILDPERGSRRRWFDSYRVRDLSPMVRGRHKSSPTAINLTPFREHFESDLKLKLTLPLTLVLHH